jgi:ABC-type multidrug transport system fused ATPase/permease subunit
MLLEEEVAEAPHMKYKRPQTPIAPQDRTENDDTSLLGSNALQSQQQDIDEQITIEQEEEAQQNLSIVFRNASFSYDSQKNVLTDVNLQVKQGEFICIVGRVGCGKSSILSALFGEAERTEGYVSVRGKLSYCCEKPWIINATIRENILFGSEFNETRYNEVVDICQLGVDMKRLPKQDLTEVGENGVNLSPGQQHRISLARAVYAPRATITLLDSTLNAVDNTVQANILQDCIVDYMKVREQRTVVLVTHSLRACEFADRIVLVEDGRISKIVNDWKDIRSEWEQITRDYEEVESPTSPQESVQSLVSPQAQEEKSESDGKLVEEEEREVGSIKMAVLYKYFAAYGIPILISCALTGVLHKVLQQGQSVWLSVWSGAADKDTRSTYYLQIYVYIGLASLVFIFLESIAFSFGNLKSTNTLHANMLDRILRARMSFFDSNPIGRILNRFTSDQFTIDYRLMYTIGWLFNEVLNCIGVVIVISYVTPWFMILIIPLMIVYYIIQMFYRATSREVRRLESISRSPLFSHVAASIRGISTIRAYACDPLLHAENKLRNDYFIRHYILRWTINRWLGIRIELIGAVIVLASSLFAVLGRFTLDPALVGLSISFSLQITIGFLMIVRLVVDAESNLTSCERIIHYGTEIPIEPPVVPDPSLVQEFYTESGKQPKDAELLKHAILPPSDWPQFGSIEFENVTVSYRPGIDRPVLNKVNLSVKEGEKIGIIGRTGAGKSTMLLTLFRFLECSEGCIKIDDFDIARVPLPDLRKHITIIPQTPVLFSGTIRSNIDVFDEFDDHQIWSALERVHIKDKIEKLSLQLLEPVSEGGSNFSIGEQALISLSRSLLYRNKIIVFDEATAHVDHHSDQLIQETIRKEFADCTTLTIAHRLDTIVDSDRVIVLDRGEVVEQGAPKVLLENTSGYFYSLVAENGDDYLRRLKDKAKKAFEKMSSSK